MKIDTGLNTENTMFYELQAGETFIYENDTILDFTMGSGTTGIACLNTNRKFIGIENDYKYFNLAQSRIEQHCNQLAIQKE